MTERRIGVAVVGLGGAVATTAVVGLGGAVATTAVVGVELLRLGVRDLSGLPLADRSDLVPYESLIFDGWDLAPDDLGQGRAPAPGGGAGATGGRCGAVAGDPALAGGRRPGVVPQRDRRQRGAGGPAAGPSRAPP